MATFALSSCYVSLNGTDRSEHISSVALSVESAELSTTDFASAGWTEVIGGLKSGTLALTFNQDMAASSIDSIMWALIGTVVAFEIRATSAAVGTGNAKYTGNLFINSWSPLDGSVGDLATVSVSFPLSGAVTRATS